jgi:hypothetical protein
MDRKTALKPRGRPVSDERGNASWEWSGGFEVDTALLKALTDGLSLDGALPQADSPKSAEQDPYNKRLASAPIAETASGRRTLDDMRRLSDEIRRKRQNKKRD